MSVTLALFKKIYDSQCTQTSQNTECPVGYSVYFLFNYICIKYLFICEKYFVIWSRSMFILHIYFLIHFQMIWHFLNIS